MNMSNTTNKNIDSTVEIKNYNTVVMGAGVSKNYRFPVGTELIEKIIKKLPETTSAYSTSPHDPFYKTMCAFYNKEPAVEIEFIEKAVKLRKYLVENRINSIDAYINTFIDKPEDNSKKKESNKIYTFLIIGIIICIITNCEQDSKTAIKDKSKFYSYFYQNFILNKTEDELKTLKIINFNYDRSFDCIMDYWLTRRNLDPDQNDLLEKENKLPANFNRVSNNLEIIHPYGWIGDKAHFEYGKIPSYSELKTIIDNNHIKVISSSRGNEKFDDIKRILKESKTIVFIGFGFDKQNLENLGYPDMRNYVQAPWFSAINEGKSRIETISNQITFNGATKSSALESRKKQLVDFFNDNSIDL